MKQSALVADSILMATALRQLSTALLQKMYREQMVEEYTVPPAAMLSF
jgi:hypothetical protein